MKPYKTEKYNTMVRENVRKMEDYCNSHPSCTRKYLSNDEFTADVCTLFNIPYSIAKRVTWFIRADGKRDEEALILWGFNRHTA